MVHLDAFEIAQQQKFNLTVLTEDEEPGKKSRWEKKPFAIVFGVSSIDRPVIFILLPFDNLY
jgi:hypothetical protein